jgi:hypothetical protein
MIKKKIFSANSPIRIDKSPSRKSPLTKLMSLNLSKLNSEYIARHGVHSHLKTKISD